MLNIIKHFLPKKDLLFSNETFAVAFLKISDDSTTKILFDFLVNSFYYLDSPILLEIGIIEKKDEIYEMNSIFRNSLLQGLYKSNVIGLKECINFNQNNLNQNTFNNLLNSIVASDLESNNYFFEINLFSGLIDHTGNITNKGFEFLLKSRKEQLWFILENSIKYFGKNQEYELFCDLMEIVSKRSKIRYLIFSEERKKRLKENDLNQSLIANQSLIENRSLIENPQSLIANSNFELFCPKNLNWLHFLSSIGLINFIDQKSFFSNTEGLFDSDNICKYLILETNFKIYAYNDINISLQKSILKLFSKITSSFPNLIKSQLDEEAFLNALSMGITVKQIIQYLKSHSFNLPRSIINQLLIWNNKQFRTKIHSGFLFSGFLQQSQFDSVCAFSKKLNVFLYKSDSNRQLFVKDKVNEIKEFIKKFS